ncbi:MAG: hypothetical protein NWE93_02590 [Candidatus Bathyarchaeota archaeon]|nr:hypothetical protein [Candidatus Bathyarchaeota archaeon]
MTDALSKNIQTLERAENLGKRFCPQCGSKMKTCCDLHRQFNLVGHRPNGVHNGPERWICLCCGLIEYKDFAMRAMFGRAGTLT